MLPYPQLKLRDKKQELDNESHFPSHINRVIVAKYTQLTLG